MSTTKKSTELKKRIEKILKNRARIPDEFFHRTDGRQYEVIWLLNRQKPSVERSYDFDEERFGITKDGRIIWGFDSGCSCPSPWSQSDFGDENYKTASTWKEFEVNPDTEFDINWEKESLQTIEELELLTKNPKDLKPDDVLNAKNAEVRRYLLKRLGYNKIKELVKANVIHKEGTSELVDITHNGVTERYVKVKDSSTDREYLLWVANWVKTCRQAIASTFNLSEEEYNPIEET